MKEDLGNHFQQKDEETVLVLRVKKIMREPVHLVFSIFFFNHYCLYIIEKSSKSKNFVSCVPKEHKLLQIWNM